MYTTVRIYAGASTLVDDLVRHQASVKAAISAIPGFRSYSLLRTAEGGGASISVCDDQAGAEATNRAAAAWIAQNLPDLAIAPPAISAGEVVVDF